MARRSDGCLDEWSIPRQPFGRSRSSDCRTLNLLRLHRDRRTIRCRHGLTLARRTNRTLPRSPTWSRSNSWSFHFLRSGGTSKAILESLHAVSLPSSSIPLFCVELMQRLPLPSAGASFLQQVSVELGLFSTSTMSILGSLSIVTTTRFSTKQQLKPVLRNVEPSLRRHQWLRWSSRWS